MNLSTILIIVTTYFIVSSCDITKRFPNIKPDEIHNELAHIISQLNEAPDDPAIFDAAFESDSVFLPTISEPLWIIPSNCLPMIFIWLGESRKVQDLLGMPIVGTV